MRLMLIAVGRRRAGPEQDLFDQYAKRLTWQLDLKFVEAKKGREGAALKTREGELLTSALPQGAVVVALDERGRSLGSEDFARKLGDWRDGGRRDIAFVIGGADGLDDDLRGRADLVLSLGKQTWPHQLVPALLVEQLYRAQCILAGHPYHRA